MLMTRVGVRCGKIRYIVVGLFCLTLILTGAPVSRDARVAEAATGGVIKADAGYDHANALFKDGTLFAWGDGQNIGIGQSFSVGNQILPLRIATGVRDVSNGHSYTLFLKKDGSVWGTGSGTSGKLGTGDYANRPYPSRVATGVKKIFAGYSQSFLIKNNGDLYAAGYNEKGVLGTGGPVDESSNTFRKVGSGFTDVVSGGYPNMGQATFGLKGTDLYAWGANGHRQLGNDTRAMENRPVKVLSGVRRVVLGSWRTHAALMTDGSVYTWGDDSFNQTGHNVTPASPVPLKVMEDVKDVALGQRMTIFLKNDGTLYYVGSPSVIQVHGQKTPAPVAAGVASIAASEEDFYFVKNDGTLWAMGKNTKGRLGLGDSSKALTPVQVLTDVKTVYADPQFDGVAFAVKKDGSLWSAGDVPLNGVKNSRMLSFGKLTFKDTTLYSPDEMKLKSLKISAGSLSPRFHKNKSSYKVTLPAKTAKVKITAVKIDARSKVQMRVGTAKFKTMSAVTVSPGKGKSKIVQIKVIGKNGWEKTCTVKVTRKKK